MSLGKYPTDPVLDAELERLNQAVKDAIAARKKWMDDHMGAYSQVQVGDEIWDLGAARRLGTVVGLYRYHSHHNPMYDTSMSIDAHYQSEGAGYQNNTSSQPGVVFGSREEAKQRAEMRAKSFG